MNALRIGVLAIAAALTAAVRVAQLQPEAAEVPGWNIKTAAAYMDGRMTWWLSWPTAARDHETTCISCHTAVPYALGRPALRAALAEQESAAPERRMLENVVKRVRLWKDVEPFYPDQTVGLPKSSESRGTESVLNALVLSRRDAANGSLSDDARLAFTNMWQLQFRSGDLKGAWAWLNFDLEPWEATGSPYFGASLAAIAVGMAPGGYGSSPDIQERVKLLTGFLQHGADSTHLFNRVMILWASTQLSGILSAEQRRMILNAIRSTQRADGGWSLSSLGPFKRVDATAPEEQSDGYATGLVVIVLQRAGLTRVDAPVQRGLDWLVQHQDSATGMWIASSLNKVRDIKTNVGKFMSDAATAYAVMALTESK